MSNIAEQSGQCNVIKTKVNDDQKEGKKSFDKKKYRLQKYSNRFKVQQWERQRKKAIVRNFYKEVNKDDSVSSEYKLNLNLKDTLRSEEKKNTFSKTMEKSFQKRDEKRRKKEEALKRKAEREKALELYKKKKAQKAKIILKKTKRGQPVMRDRLLQMLEKIQKG